MEKLPWTRRPKGGWTPEQVKAEAIEWFEKHPQRCVNDAGGCMYRNDEGLGCAVGIFLPDKVVTENEIEGDGIDLIWPIAEDADVIREAFLGPDSPSEAEFDWMHFLDEMQSAHDDPIGDQTVADRIREIEIVYR